MHKVGLELLTQADYVLNNCGRPVPPKGFKFVDLPKIIPFHHTPNTTFIPGPNYCYISETGGVVFNNITAPPVVVTLIIAESGVGAPSITVVGNTITIQVGAGPLTITEFISLWNSTLAASSQASAQVARASCGTETSSPATTPFFINPVTQALATGTLTFNEIWPSQDYVSNNSNTLFLCRGLMLQTDPIQVRIKWPNGRYWNQFPSGNPLLSASACFPQGTGGNLYALDEEVAIERDAKVAVEMTGPNPGGVDVHLWGVLRYLLKDNGINLLPAVGSHSCIVGYPAAAKSQGPPTCLIGYPVNTTGGVKTIPDPIEVLKQRPRFSCWPNGNIMAPEFRLGNQCETDTPEGYEDESFTFLSGVPPGTPFVIPGGSQLYSNQVALPGQEDIIVRRFRAIITWAGGATGNPVAQLRLPNGYSLTGGDQIPLFLGYWFPVFPTLKIAAGTILIVDLADPLQGDGGTINVTLEFDAVKRRKIR